MSNKTIQEIIKEIDPGTFYSASHVIRQGWIGWVKTVLTFTMFLNTEEGKRLYRPIITHTSASKRYKIPGSALIEVLQMVEKGELKIDK